MRRADAVLGALLLCLVAWALVAPPIWTRGEAREALVVRDIVRNGHWVIAYRDGTLASKPPFFHWIAAVAAHVLGLHDFVVRLPSAAGAFAMLATTFALGTRIGGRGLGALGAGILAAMPLFWRFATEARVDMVFAAALTLALAAFHVRDADGTSPAALAFVAASVAAVLTKGPAGLVLPAAAIVVHLAFERRLAQLSRWIWPVAAAGAIAAVWYTAAYAVAGRHFLDVQLLHENVERLVGGTEDFERTGGRELNLPAAFAANLLPWNLVLVWSAWRWWRGEREDRTGHLLHAWWMVIVGIFALAPRTRTVYLLPTYPAVALLAARALVPRATRAVRTAIGVAAVAILVATQAARLHEARRDPLRAFAARIRPRVPATAALRAGPLLSENDALVLRWLLDRSIVRGPLECRPDTLALAPAASFDKAAALGLRIVDHAGTGDRRIALLECAR